MSGDHVSVYIKQLVLQSCLMMKEVRRGRVLLLSSRYVYVALPSCCFDPNLVDLLIVPFYGTMQGIFDRYDRDRSGKIDSRELTEALRSIGYAVPPSVIELLIANYNNGVPSNGALDFDNFVE